MHAGNHWEGGVGGGGERHALVKGIMDFGVRIETTHLQGEAEMNVQYIAAESLTHY